MDARERLDEVVTLAITPGHVAGSWVFIPDDPNATPGKYAPKLLAKAALDAALAATDAVECGECRGRGEVFYGTWPTGDDDHDIERCAACAGEGTVSGARLVYLASELEQVGTVNGWGGGLIDVLVPRDLPSYPPDGTVIFIRPASTTTPTGDETP